jgi:tight adherence protein C
MNVILLVGLLLTGTAVGLLARGVVMARGRASETIAQINAYGFARARVEKKQTRPLSSRLDWFVTLIGGAVARRLGGLREAEMRAELMAAGMYGTTPRKLIGYRIVAAVGVPLFWMWGSSTAGYPAAVGILGLIVAVPLGWLAPMRIVRRRADSRLAEIDYDLPELIDLLVVTVEAGLGLSGSLQVASQRLRGPLGDELRLALQEQSMGLSTTETLRNMLGRCDTPLMHSFVRSVVQGETLGVSIGQIMRDLATEMRKRRRQAAEERAQKAPTKILFPLVFLIFPAMFVVLLGPAIFAFLDAFGG